MLMRLRTLTPRVFLNRKLFLVEEKTGLPARLFFMGLWCAADREGRFEWTEDLKPPILPYDDADIMAILDALEKAGFVEHYWHDGRKYGVIPTFTEEQVINNRESASRLPNPKLANGVRSRQSAVDMDTLALPGFEEPAANGAKPRKSTRKPSGSWSSRAIAMYGDRLGGVPPAGKIVKFLKPLIERHGEELTLAAWDIYLANKDPQFIQPADFASHFNLWTPEGFKQRPTAPAKRGTPPTFAYTPNTTLPPEQD